MSDGRRQAAALACLFGALHFAAWISLPGWGAGHDAVIVPLRDARKGEDGTTVGIGLARYLERDVHLLRPSVRFAPAGVVLPCLSSVGGLDRKRVFPHQLRTLAGCCEAREVFWGTFASYEDRFTVVLDHWSDPAEAQHRLEASGSAEAVFSTIDRLVLELAEQEGWGVSREAQRALEERETDSFTAYLSYWEGRRLFSEGAYAEALDRFEAAVREDPAFPWARLFIGNSYSRQGDAAKAEAAFRALTEEEPSFLPGFINLGRVLAAQGKRRAALRTYRRAPEGRESPALLFNLGNIYRVLEMDTETRNAYEAAIRLAPEFADAYYQLALFYRAREVIDRARENFLRARRFRSELTQEIFDLGIPLKDICIEDDVSYQAEIGYGAVRLEAPAK